MAVISKNVSFLLQVRVYCVLLTLPNSRGTVDAFYRRRSCECLSFNGSPKIFEDLRHLDEVYILTLVPNMDVEKAQ